MNQRCQNILLIGSVALLTSVISHLGVVGLGLETAAIHRSRFDTHSISPPVLMLGSSLVLNALDLNWISKAAGRAIEIRSAPSASVSELDILRNEVEGSNLLVLGVSMYDLNEHFLCDFRSEIVPFSRTVSDLWRLESNWSEMKPFISQYALTAIRKVYPSAGRSYGILVGIRSRLKQWRRGFQSKNSDVALTMDPENKGGTNESILSWSNARTLRNEARLRAVCGGKHTFDGLKRLALFRIMEDFCKQGDVAVLVLPVSPPYREDLVDVDAISRFENLLGEIGAEYPSVQVIRLDQQERFNDGALYLDLVHMNRRGRMLATEAFLAEIQGLSLP